MPLPRYGFVLLPGFSLLSLAGALDVLTAAGSQFDAARCECLLLGLPPALPAGWPAAAGPLEVAARCGARLAVQPLGSAPRLEALFVVADGPCDAASPGVAGLLAWLRAQDDGRCTLGGIGTGAAWLAEAGLLAGLRATVHWPEIGPLAERHPEVLVSQHVYEIDRLRLSCAGHQASRDLMIAWLGQRHGERLAQVLAAHFGLERVRARDDRQRVPLTERLVIHAGGGGSAKLAEAVALMEANLAEPLPTEDIARLVGVSRRQLERLFKQHLDALPSRWYVSLRLQRARRLLRQSSQSVLQIGLACGFASGPHFSNAYRAHFGRTPREERSQRAAAWRDAAQDGCAAAGSPGATAQDGSEGGPR